MDSDLQRRKAVEERAYALWDAAGRPEGGDLMYWLIAEEELESPSVAGEEDPGSAVGDLAPGEMITSPSTAPSKAALRRAVESGVPEAELPPSAEAENPTGRRVRSEAKAGGRAKR